MNLLIPIEAFDNFKEVKDFPIADLSPDLIPAVKKLDEREEFEPFLRSILTDTSPTPHGPAEIVDIFTHQVVVNGQHGMAAFILKGRNSPQHRTHSALPIRTSRSQTKSKTHKARH
jgi:hypothetical protein